MLFRVFCGFLIAAPLYGASLKLSIDEGRVSDPGVPIARELTLSNSSDAMEQVRVVVELCVDSEFQLEDGLSRDVRLIPEMKSVLDHSIRYDLDLEPGASEVIPVVTNQSVEVGFYALVIQVTTPDETYQLIDHHFVLHETLPELPADSRFGLNCSSLDFLELNRRLGVGWIRFENLKWAFTNPAPDQFAYDGSVGPWFVDHDKMVRAYTEAGFNFTGYYFQSPLWASSAPETIEARRRHSYPPSRYKDYEDAVFQTVARYGEQKHPESVLKTEDKASGLGGLCLLELWNEVNLNDPGWGFWVASVAEYFEMFRPAALAARKADPNVMISHSSYAGIGLELVDQLRTYTYDDGTHPLDYTDIINVHFYTGKALPELATLDPNANRTGEAMKGASTVESNLNDLDAWRRQFKPDAEIWLTETGYDIGGKIGSGLRMQAAKLPRSLMMALACGVDRVFWYREKGSTPSQHAGAGLVDNDGNLHPSWLTMATMIRQLKGAGVGDALQLPYADSNVRMYLWDTDAGPVLSVWAIEGGATVDMKLGAAIQVDAFGYEQNVVQDEPWRVGDFPVYLRDFEGNDLLEELKARAIELSRVQEVSRQAALGLSAHLFDFGSDEHRGLYKKDGSFHPFQTVTVGDAYNATRGYGFTQPAVEDGDVRGYWKLPLERDYSRFDAETVFTLDIAPGHYDIEARVLGTKKGSAAHLLVQPESKEPFELAVSTSEGIQANVTGELVVDVAGRVEFRFDQPVDVFWLTLLKR